MSKKKLSGSVRAIVSLVGSVIGAGFITGREIMRFFFGKNVFLTGICLFVVFFLIFYFLFANRCEFVQKIIEKSNAFICLFNLIIIASMMSATDSLFDEVFGINKRFCLFSVILFTVSTFVCFKGIKNLGNVNLIIVPLMLVVLFAVILFSPLSKNAYSSDLPNFTNLFGYVCMNCLLSQPLITQIRKKEEISPFFVALFLSLILSVCVAAYLLVLSEECRVCDLPILTLVSNNLFSKIVVFLVMLMGIVTTQFGAHYPIINGFVDKSFSVFKIVCTSLICFLLSGMGFYQIVDYLYPIIAVLSEVYFVVIIPISLIFFAKVKRKRTLVKPKCIAKRCLTLRDRVLIPDHRKQ